jgi:hypothetical protein
MPSLHDHDDPATDNDEGLNTLAHAVACSSTIDDILFQAFMRTPAPPRTDDMLFDARMATPPPPPMVDFVPPVASQLAPKLAVIPDLGSCSILWDCERHITEQLKTKLRRRHLPDDLVQQVRVDAWHAARLAEWARPQKRQRC